MRPKTGPEQASESRSSSLACVASRPRALLTCRQFYLKQRIDHPELADGAPGDATGLEGAAGPLAPPPAPTELSTWSWWGSAPPSPTSTHSALGSLPTQLSSMLSSTLDLSDPDLPAIPKALPSLGNLNGEDVVRMSNAANEWMAFLLVTVGAFLFIGGCLNYWRAVRYVPPQLSDRMLTV